MVGGMKSAVQKPTPEKCARLSSLYTFQSKSSELMVIAIGGVYFDLLGNLQQVEMLSSHWL